MNSNEFSNQIRSLEVKLSAAAASPADHTPVGTAEGKSNQTDIHKDDSDKDDHDDHDHHDDDDEHHEDSEHSESKYGPSDPEFYLFLGLSACKVFQKNLFVYILFLTYQI